MSKQGNLFDFGVKNIPQVSTVERNQQINETYDAGK